MLSRTNEGRSCHGEKLWHREADVDRANGSTRHRKPATNERCRIAPQA
jgi:hypothetical protein